MITVTLPLRLVSEANRRDHWTVKAKRARDQRTAVYMMLWHKVTEHREYKASPLTVTITRIAPRRLDDDNAVSSAKAVRDGIADALWMDDRDDRVTWVYAQERGKYGLRIEIQEAT